LNAHVVWRCVEGAIALPYYRHQSGRIEGEDL
jgi:hypothetical protein